MHVTHYFQLLGVTLLVMVSNVLASVLYMVVYGHVLNPGQEPAHYQQHIQVAGPYCSIVAGIPLLFAAGYWVSNWYQRRFQYRPSLIVWGWYLLLDTTILAFSGLTMNLLLLVAASFLTKLIACLAGAYLRLSPPKTTPSP